MSSVEILKAKNVLDDYVANINKISEEHINNLKKLIDNNYSCYNNEETHGWSTRIFYCDSCPLFYGSKKYLCVPSLMNHKSHSPTYEEERNNLINEIDKLYWALCFAKENGIYE